MFPSDDEAARQTEIAQEKLSMLDNILVNSMEKTNVWETVYPTLYLPPEPEPEKATLPEKPNYADYDYFNHEQFDIKAPNPDDEKYWLELKLKYASEYKTILVLAMAGFIIAAIWGFNS